MPTGKVATIDLGGVQVITAELLGSLPGMSQHARGEVEKLEPEGVLVIDGQVAVGECQGECRCLHTQPVQRSQHQHFVSSHATLPRSCPSAGTGGHRTPSAVARARRSASVQSQLVSQPQLDGFGLMAVQVLFVIAGEVLRRGRRPGAGAACRHAVRNGLLNSVTEGAMRRALVRRLGAMRIRNRV